MLSEGRSKGKPTRLSDKGAENNLLNHSDNIYIYIYVSVYRTSSQIIMAKQICACELIFSLKLMGSRKPSLDIVGPGRSQKPPVFLL